VSDDTQRLELLSTNTLRSRPSPFGARTARCGARRRQRWLEDKEDQTLRSYDIFGFNYDGSWGSSGLDLWAHHDRDLMAIEIARGKRYFPEWNIARKLVAVARGVLAAPREVPRGL
jgi:hypothetical protein